MTNQMKSSKTLRQEQGVAAELRSTCLFFVVIQDMFSVTKFEVTVKYYILWKNNSVLIMS